MFRCLSAQFHCIQLALGMSRDGQHCIMLASEQLRLKISGGFIVKYQIFLQSLKPSQNTIHSAMAICGESSVDKGD